MSRRKHRDRGSDPVAARLEQLGIDPAACEVGPPARLPEADPPPAVPARPGPKYHNRPVTTADGRFDSQRELARWVVLRLAEDGGAITALRRQVPFPVFCPRTGERLFVYVADFVYCDRGGGRVVEDAKGVRTPTYRLKKRLVESVYNLTIVEV